MTEKKHVNISAGKVTQLQLDNLSRHYNTKSSAVAVAVDRLCQELQQQEKTQQVIRLTIEWLNNLEKAMGLEKLLDQMPNNFGGRAELQELIE